MAAGGAVVHQVGPITIGNLPVYLTDGGIGDSGIGNAGDVVAGTTYTLATSDNGHIKSFTNGSAVTLTVNAGTWKSAFSIGIIQSGVGAVTPTAGTGVTITNRQSHTATAGQGALASLVADPAAADHWIFAGDTA